jgi:hypothetical protein
MLRGANGGALDAALVGGSGSGRYANGLLQANCKCVSTTEHPKVVVRTSTLPQQASPDVVGLTSLFPA